MPDGLADVDRSALAVSRAAAPTVFESPRLRCRHWVARDRAAVLEVYGDADAMRWVGDGTVLSEADADRWLDVTESNYAWRGYGMFALEDQATGQLVGLAGLVHPGDQPEAEVKYALARAWWGRGLATEAVRHLLEAAASRYGLTDVIATVAPANVASQRVLAKAGMTRRADRVHDDGTRTVVFGCALPPAFTVYLVTAANRDLLERVEDDVFDHPVRAAGAALVDALLRRGRELGCREGWVATEVGNLPARGLYGALGGVEDDERAVVYVFSLAEDGAKGIGGP